MEKQKIFKYLFLTLLLILSSNIYGEKTKTTDTPWDTVIANLQIIESMTQPDSVKTALTQELFSDFQIKSEDYEKFYNKFFKKPPDQQTKFLKKVEEIILNRINNGMRQTR